MPADATPLPPAPADRGSRRRAKTRASLLGAALALFAERGIEATRIADITERADVGFGSFYNHFADKDEIVEAVAGAAIEGQGRLVEGLTAGLDDPAEVVAVAHRHFVRIAADRSQSAWLLVRMDMTDRVFEATVGDRARRHVDAGLASGRFRAADPGLVLYATGGALAGVMRHVLERDAAPDPGAAADELHAEVVLRMLGVDAEDAAEVARRPFPAASDEPPGAPMA